MPLKVRKSLPAGIHPTVDDMDLPELASRDCGGTSRPISDIQLSRRDVDGTHLTTRCAVNRRVSGESVGWPMYVVAMKRISSPATTPSKHSR